MYSERRTHAHETGFIQYSTNSKNVTKTRQGKLSIVRVSIAEAARSRIRCTCRPIGTHMKARAGHQLQFINSKLAYRPRPGKCIGGCFVWGFNCFLRLLMN